MLGPRVGGRQRPLGDHGPSRDGEGRRAVRRRHRPRRRRRVRPRRDAQPPRLSRAPRCGPRPRGVARPAARRARADDRGGRTRTRRAGRHRRRRFVRPLHHRRAVRGTRGSERAVDGEPTARGRSAPDQQRGRREQLRHARAEPAEPRLRPRHLGRRRLPGSLRLVGGAPHHPRRRGPRAHRSRPAHLRRPRCADRAGRDHGRGGHRDHRRHLHRGARMRVVRAVRDRRHGDADGPAQRRLVTVRARRRPLRHRPWRRPLRRAARRDVPGAGGARRSGRRPHRGPPGAGAELRRARRQRQPHPRHRPRARRPRPAARPDRLHRRRGRRRRGRGVAVVATGLDRGDRRHRGGRAPLRLRQHRRRGCRGRRCTVT